MTQNIENVGGDLSGCKADVRRLSCKPVSFDSANACDHFKIILILPIGIETFYSRCAAKTDRYAHFAWPDRVAHRPPTAALQTDTPRSSLALTPNEALTRSVTLLCKDFRPDTLAQSLRHRRRFLQGGIRHHDTKLFSAHSAQQIALPNRAGQRTGHHRQHPVPA